MNESQCGEFTIERVGGRVVVGEGGGWEGWRGNRTRVTNSVQPAACVTCSHAGLHPSQVRFLLGCELCPPDCTPDQLGLEDEEILNVELMARPCGQHGVRRLASWVALWCCAWLSRCGRSGFSKPLIRFPSFVGRDVKFSQFADSSERKIVQHSEGRGWYAH